MSFSSDLKEELLHITAESPCCRLAESYGLMLFGRAFSSRELSISTENEAVAQKYQYLAKRLCLHAPEMQKQTAKKYKVSVTDSADRLRRHRARAALKLGEYYRGLLCRRIFARCIFSLRYNQFSRKKLSSGICSAALQFVL